MLGSVLVNALFHKRESKRQRHIRALDPVPHLSACLLPLSARCQQEAGGGGISMLWNSVHGASLASGAQQKGKVGRHEVSLFFLINKQTVPGVAQPGHRNVSWVAAHENDRLWPVHGGRQGQVYLARSQSWGGKALLVWCGSQRGLPALLVLGEETKRVSLPMTGREEGSLSLYRCRRPAIAASHLLLWS